MENRSELGRQRKLFIGGEWRPASDGATQPVINPATGEAFTEVPAATVDDVGAALDAAKKAQPAWAALAPIERASYLHRVAALLLENQETLARILTTEVGKPIREARGEVAGAANFFTYYAEAARRIQGEILPSDARDEHVLITRVPYGVVAAIIPWNYPAALCGRKIAPALITGNTIVLKASSETPVSALFVAEMIEKAGVPAGVVNVLTGSGKLVGEALVADKRTNMVTMTGSGPVGKRILEIAAKNMTPVSLELGGKAPFIVMADADLDRAVRCAVTARFTNCGQVCTCNERMLVQRKVYDQFVERYVDLVGKLRVGDPFQETTDIGPKVSKAELEKVEEMVDTACSQGAEVVLGGKRTSVAGFEGGYWFAPTVLANVKPEMEIVHEEIFGPVSPVMPFDEFEEAVAIANDSKYGLSAYLFTNDLRLAMNAMRQIDFGEVYINRVGPEQVQGFHVGYRDSGLGGDDGHHGLEHYLRKKTVYLNYSTEMPAGLMPYSLD